MITPNHQEVAVHLLRTYHVVEPIIEVAGQYLGRIIDGAYGGTAVEDSGTARHSSSNAPCNASNSYACSTEVTEAPSTARADSGGGREVGRRASKGGVGGCVPGADSAGGRPRV